MFGQAKQPSEAEAERAAAIEQSKKTVRVLVHTMHDVSPEEAERVVEKIKEIFTSDKLLPFDFRQKAFKRMRELECIANMREADHMLHKASEMAVEENMKERGFDLGEARKFYSKACTLGADDDWRKAFQRSAEAILMTGGVQHKGPTRAKPLDLAPKAPNRAKPDADIAD
jgi:hypothetical protein